MSHRGCGNYSGVGLWWRRFRNRGTFCLSSVNVLSTDVRGGYTLGMKTAVSIPNELFEVAERLARRTRKSRSRLFSDALREYVARRSPDKVTEAMDQALAEIGESNDGFVAAASRRRLEHSEW